MRQAQPVRDDALQAMQAGTGCSSSTASQVLAGRLRAWAYLGFLPQDSANLRSRNEVDHDLMHSETHVQ